MQMRQHADDRQGRQSGEGGISQGGAIDKHVIIKGQRCKGKTQGNQRLIKGRRDRRGEQGRRRAGAGEAQVITTEIVPW